MEDYEFYRQKFLNGRNVKRRELRILRRKKEEFPEDYSLRESKLRTGSVWGIEDKSVSFDTPRDPSVLKDGLRPCLCLEKPADYHEYQTALMAPGTSKFHRLNIINFPTLAAQINPKSNITTTYFLLYASWHAMQKTLQKHFTDLSETDFAELQNLRGIHAETAD